MLKRITAIAIFALLVTTAFAQSKDQANMTSLIDSLVQPYMQNHAIPGAAVAVYFQGHDYIFTYGYANKEQKIPVTPNTIFELASITKIFTTSLLAYEVKQNKMALDDQVIKYLPTLSKTANLPIDNVQLVNLATHTAGFPRDIEGFNVTKGDEPGLLNAFKSWHSDLIIGKNYRYSNVGFGLLGRALENATKQPYFNLLDKTILQPLQMQNTFIVVPAAKQNLQAQGYNLKLLPAPYFEPTFLLGGGALRSSAADLLQFMKANLNIPVANASPNLLQTFQYAQQAIYTVRPNFVMALGWQRINRKGMLYITKNGANRGFNTFIGFSPDKKFGVIVLTNKKDAQANRLGNQILNQLATFHPV